MALIQEARRNNLKLVFLWFGSWKNGLSSYAPYWVKKDYKRFPRIRTGGGRTSNCSARSEPPAATRTRGRIAR